MVGVGVSGCVGVKLNNSNELTKGPDSWFYGVSGPEREVSQNPVLVDTVCLKWVLKKKRRRNPFCFWILQLCCCRHSEPSVSPLEEKKKKSRGKVGRETIISSSSVRCTGTNPALYFKENHLVRPSALGWNRIIPSPFHTASVSLFSCLRLWGTLQSLLDPTNTRLEVWFWLIVSCCCRIVCASWLVDADFLGMENMFWRSLVGSEAQAGVLICRGRFSCCMAWSPFLHSIQGSTSADLIVLPSPVRDAAAGRSEETFQDSGGETVVTPRLSRLWE